VWRRIFQELKNHAPFTTFGAMTGILIMVFFQKLPKEISLNILLKNKKRVKHFLSKMAQAPSLVDFSLRGARRILSPSGEGRALNL